MKKNTLYCTLIMLALPVLNGCSSHAVRGIPPFVQINGLAVEPQGLTLDLGVRNANSLLLEIQRIEFSLALNEADIASYDAASKVTISANGTENLRFSLPADSTGSRLLSELESGDRQSLEYTLEGLFTVVEDGDMKFRRKGHIYPVPGRPGQFR